MTTQITHDEAVLKVIEQIYASHSIPESHKQKYVDYIKTNGFTDKMLDELEKFFEDDAKILEEDTSTQKEIVQELNSQIQQEQMKNDEAQAAILSSVHEANQKLGEDLIHEIEQTELDIERSFEQVGKTAETKEIESIRAKLQQK